MMSNGAPKLAFNSSVNRKKETTEKILRAARNQKCVSSVTTFAESVGQSSLKDPL